MLDPGLNQSLRTNGDGAWFGWPKDDKLEALRSQWMRAPDSEARQEIAAAIQQRAFEVVPYIPTGQWNTRTAYGRSRRPDAVALVRGHSAPNSAKLSVSNPPNEDQGWLIG
jgi:ABC-type transport system substrate-binding protein